MLSPYSTMLHGGGIDSIISRINPANAVLLHTIQNHAAGFDTPKLRIYVPILI